MEEVESYRSPWAHSETSPEVQKHDLNTDQRRIFEKIDQHLSMNRFHSMLIHGVTGSGKTEIYLNAIASTLARGRSALVLVPEIGLTPQISRYFRAWFGEEVAILHSALSRGERFDQWRRIREGQARVVVGTRSAVFAPLADLGIIIVDEEHDSSYKQEDGVVYHARDMAVVRAHIGKILIVLASATPSLETLTNVVAGRYECQKLTERHGAAVLPAVSLIDLRRDPPKRLEGLSGSAGQSWLSAALRAAIAETLAAGEQAMLYLNRRGYAPLTLCRSCGHRLQCPNCTAWLVEHRLIKRLQCHHCGLTTALPDSCPSCDAKVSLAACGPGVERLGEEVKRLFPAARQATMASDTLTGPAAAAVLVEEVQKGEVDILIGTQIAAKGHHFPKLTLVGVVDGDLGLYGGDLRAGERSFQLLQQVAGRAGRAEHPGRVLVQTAEPEHPVMQALRDGDRDRFMAIESEQRQRAGLPPFGRLAAVIVTAPDQRLLDEFARGLLRRLPERSGFQVLGPAPAPLAVLRGRHRRRFLVKAPRNAALQDFLRTWLGDVKTPGQLRLRIDVDPYSFL
jgi:primosomal protein N' (replication factor Y)